MRSQLSRSSTPDEKVRPVVAVLGAGVAGVLGAKQLTKHGFYVVLYDKNKEILLGSSNATPGRPTHGFHYVHPETGKFCLTETMELLKEFPGATRGAGTEPNHFMRHGFYVLMKEKPALIKMLEEEEKMSSADIERLLDIKDETTLSPEDAVKARKIKDTLRFASLFPRSQILDTYEQLKKFYAQKVAEDGNNELFGEPDQFYTIISPAIYKDTIDTKCVSDVVVTNEELFDWPKIRTRLVSDVNINDFITTQLQTEIISVRYDVASQKYVISTNRGEFTADYVLNATWENIEAINKTMGFPIKPDHRTNRLKVIVKVILPTALKQMNSMFFCMGAHCMFSNMGDGTGMITYAPVTNLHSSTAIEVDADIRAYLSGQADMDHQMELARKVLEGVIRYIPAMRGAQITGVNFGIIKTLGDVDILDPNSQFHQRDYLGIDEQQIGWVDSASMKLIHCIHNGRRTTEIFIKHRQALEKISEIVDHFYDLTGTPKIAGIPSFPGCREQLIHHLRISYTADELLNPNPIITALRQQFPLADQADEKVAAPNLPVVLPNSPAKSTNLLSRIYTSWCSLPTTSKLTLGFSLLAAAYVTMNGMSNSCQSLSNMLSFWCNSGNNLDASNEAPYLSSYCGRFTA